MRIKLSGLIYSGMWLVYSVLLLFLVAMNTGTSLADNVTVDNSTVDKTELTKVIISASAKLRVAIAGIEPGQYPQSAVNAFDAAIAKAESVADDINATQVEVNKTLMDFKAAEAIFDAAMIKTVNKSALTTAINAASSKVSSSFAGIDIGHYPQSSITVFNAAIATAQMVANDASATQAAVNQALADLTTAEATFDAAMIKTVNRSALSSAITAASSKVTGAVAGTAIGQYPQTAIDTFNSAISKAQAVLNSASSTQTQVNQATRELKAAEATFDAAMITTGDTTPPSSVTNLQAASAGSSWIRWTWANPNDPDFSHVAVYINGAFVANTLNSSVSFYNATGLTGGTTYTVGLHTVDTSGNIGTTWVNSSATTTVDLDTIPPASVTSLMANDMGESWIRWTWVNPADMDLSQVMVYMNGIFVTNISNTSINYYNATGLDEGTTYTIGLHTVDTSGNVNSAEVNSSATTLKLPEILRLSGTNITASSITLAWEASNDTTSVQIQRNNFILGDISGSSSYVDSNLSISTTYRYILTPFNEKGVAGKDVTISLRTASSRDSGGSSGGTTTKSSSSGGGSGGSTSTEDFANIAMKDADSEYLRMNTNVTYNFRRPGNAIQSIRFYSLKNSGEITSTVEVLNSRSKMVNSSPEGLVYKYVNIWVGKSNFATSDNIKDIWVKFKVNNSWTEEMGISPENVKLHRYNGNAWEVLPTVMLNNTTSDIVFESRTAGFSAFAITAEKTLASVSENIETSSQANGPEDMENNTHLTDGSDIEGTQGEKSNTAVYLMAIIMIGVIAGGYVYLKRQ